MDTVYQGEPPQFLLHTFLRHVFFPECDSNGVSFKSLSDGDEHSPWPLYEELKRGTGTRPLREIKKIDLWDFKTVVRNHLDLSGDAYIKPDSAPYIKLPCLGFAAYEHDELESLVNVNNEDKLRKVMVEYLLNTICECVRLLVNLPRDAPFAKALHFKVDDSERFYMDKKPVWDFLVMPYTTHGRVPLTVICVPPWILSRQALEAFAKPRTLEDGELDTIVTGASDATDEIVNTLWAVIHDDCRKRGSHHFIVTNYCHWSFGQLSLDRTLGTLTPPIEAALIDVKTGELKITKVPYACTVSECLVYWIEVARGAAAVDSSFKL